MTALWIDRERVDGEAAATALAGLGAVVGPLRPQPGPPEGFVPPPQELAALLEEAGRLWPARRWTARRVILSERSYPGVDLSDAVLEHGLLVATDLSGARLDRVAACNVLAGGLRVAAGSLAGADFSGALLVDADLTGVFGQGALFASADLSGARFDRARLDEASFAGATCWGTSFVAADLRAADLTGADLRDADLSGAQLDGARGLTRGG